MRMIFNAKKILIEKAWGGSVDNATFSDIKTAIQETLKMDEEHGAFWAEDWEGRNALEVHKDLEIFYTDNSDNQEKTIKAFLENWDEVEKLYSLFFDNKFKEIEILLKQKLNK